MSQYQKTFFFAMIINLTITFLMIVLSKINGNIEKYSYPNMEDCRLRSSGTSSFKTLLIMNGH
jgi:hypothetical protein